MAQSGGISICFGLEFTLLFTFVLLGLLFTMFVFNNNDFEMEKEDRVLLEQDTPVLSEVR